MDDLSKISDDPELYREVASYSIFSLFVLLKIKE